MAYAVDWIGKVITIPTSDLDFVSGTRYELQMSDFLGEIRRLEAAFNEGLWAPQILEHANPRLDFVGTNYVGFDEVINGYQIQVSGVATRVDLIGSNNNIVDVLIPTGVSVVPSNSAGLQKVSTGGGLDPTEKVQIRELHEHAGLDESKPVTYTKTSISWGSITLNLTGDGKNTTIVTRQP